MTKARGRVFFHNPTWSTSEYGRRNKVATGFATPAGIVHVTAPAHPHASTASEQWLEFDGNSAVHALTPTSVFLADNYSAGYGTGPNYTPDSTLRWGAVCRFLFRHGKTAGVNDTLPTSDALLAQFSEVSVGTGTHSTVWRVYYTTTGTLKFTTQDFTPGAGTETTLGTSAVLSTLTNYQIEMWSVHLDATGTVLAGNIRNAQLRVLSNITTSPPTVTTAVNVNRAWESQDNVLLGTTGLQFGEDAARGANFRFYLGNLYVGWENAGDPFGTVRMDRLDVNGESAGANMNQWTGAFTDADETGTALPDDVTTEYTSAPSAGAPTTQMMTLTAGSYMTGSDLPISVQVSLDAKCTLAAKGLENYDDPVLGDGTNLIVYGPANEGSSGWLYLTAGATTNAALAALALSDIAGMEAGVRGTHVGAGAPTHEFSTVTVIASYQKAGETAAALDPIPSTGKAFPFKRGRALQPLLGR